MNTFFHNIGWHPSIGDPSFMGWLTVALYFFCSYRAYGVVKHSEKIFDSLLTRQRNLWLAIAFILLALGLNKQLDLQTFFTATAKYLAHEHGWYQDRRVYQRIFIFGIGGLGLLSALGLFIYYIRILREHTVAIVGLCSLIVFVLVRASSFHDVDLFLGSRILGVKMNWFLELGGIVLIAYNASQLIKLRYPRYRRQLAERRAKSK